MKKTIQTPASWIMLTLIVLVASGAFLSSGGPSFSRDQRPQQTDQLNTRLTPTDLLW